jgi:hypothetical protein
MKHTVKLLTLAATLVAVIGLVGCSVGANINTPCKHENKKVEIIKAATCTETGIEKITCKDCGEVIEEKTISARGHDYGDWEVTKEATCTEDGEKKHTCKREGCEHFETEVIPAAHDYQGGYCEKCKTYKFENGSKIYVNVYTLENNEPLKKDYLRYSFEEKNVVMELNDLIHLKFAL